MSLGSSCCIAALLIGFSPVASWAQGARLQRHAPPPTVAEPTDLGRVVTVGMATAGSAGLLELAMLGLPVVGSPFQIEVQSGSPGAAGYLVIGLGEALTALPELGAVLHPAAPWQYQPFLLDADGVSGPLLASVSVPAATWGSSLWVQAFVLDPLAQGGAAVTQAAELRFGGDRGWTILPVPAIRLSSVPRDGAFADLDRDGKLDLVSVQSGFMDAVTIWLGTSELDEPLRAAGSYPLGQGPKGLAIADLDGDGNLDLAVSQDSADLVTVLLGTGDGAFVSGTSFAVDSPGKMAAADVDNDGELDLGVAQDSNDRVQVFLGNGNGTFVSATLRSVGNFPQDVLLEDLDVDGAPELIVGHTGGLDLLAGNGDGTFGPRVQHAAPDASGLASGDFDEDGALDIASNRSFFAGTGGGSLAPAQALPWNLHFPLAQDMDRDGHLDLAGYGAVFFGAGDGTFGEQLSYTVSSANFETLAAGDLDGDGGIEIAIAESNQWSLHHGLESGSVASTTVYSVWPTGSGTIQLAALAVGDVDGDQVADVVSGNDFSLDILVSKGKGDGTLEDPVVLPAGPASTGLDDVNSIQIVDLDGDTLPDLLVSVHGSALQPRVLVAYGQGGGSFDAFQALPTNATSEAAAAADLDGDGIQDVLIASYFGDAVQVLLGEGGRSFAPAVTHACGDQPVALFVGDLDGNDLLDVVTANESSDDLTVLFGLGGGTLGNRLDLPAGDEPRSLDVGDVDGNGSADLLVVNDDPSSIALLSGLGGGAFAPAADLLVFAARALRVTDLTADGIPDIVVATGVGVDILTNRGTCTFELRTYDSNGVSSSVGVGDLNRDLIPDVITGGSFSMLRVLPQRYLDPER